MSEKEALKQLQRQIDITCYLETQIWKLRNEIDSLLSTFNSGLADQDDPRNIGIIETCNQVAKWFNERIASQTSRCGKPIELKGCKEFKVNFPEDVNKDD